MICLSLERFTRMQSVICNQDRIFDHIQQRLVYLKDPMDIDGENPKSKDDVWKYSMKNSTSCNPRISRKEKIGREDVRSILPSSLTCAAWTSAAISTKDNRWNSLQSSTNLGALILSKLEFFDVSTFVNRIQFRPNNFSPTLMCYRCWMKCDENRRTKKIPSWRKQRLIDKYDWI